MKKTAFALLLIIPFALVAQKEIKPSVGKAEKALKEGKFDEAKAIIDATTSSQEFMVDKKGNPSKNAAKAWYLKGLIYAGIDTTKVQKFKSLEAEPYKVAVEAFNKSKELSKDEISYFSNEVGLPLLNTQLSQQLAQSYLTKSLDYYQKDKDYKKAFEYMERVLYFIPEDTSMIMNTGVFFAPSAEEYGKAEEYIKKYHAKGGKNPDSYIQLFSIYRDKKKDNEKALALAQEMIKKFPNNSEYPKYELDMYIKMNRLPEAKAIMEKQAKADPNDKESRYYLGIISSELKDPVDAKRWFEEAVKVDPKYFDAQLGLAEIVYFDAKKIKVEMNNLGNSKEELKKKIDMDKTYQEKLRIALPYYVSCEKLNPDEAKVLDTLYLIYTDLEMAPQVARIEKRMKALGLLD